MVALFDKSLVFRTWMFPFSSTIYVFVPSGVKASGPPLVRLAESEMERGVVAKFKEKRLSLGDEREALTTALVASGVMATKRGTVIPVNGLSAVGG